jgi:TPR repeat protein
MLLLSACGEGGAAPVQAPSAASPVPAHPSQSAAAPSAHAHAATPEAQAAPSAECASGEACFDAASTAERDKQPERAAPLYTRACELGVGQACHRLGVMHLEGKGVARDEDKARELFEVGCRQDSAAACDALGH